ncbi:MAG: sugar phosphate isomerase/epimerase [Chloroflexota bacterium]|nr:sugar phosphate isomerase/epimerase [Chloroflexota bacterium]
MPRRLLGGTLSDFLNDLAERHHDQTALTFGEDRRTFGQLPRRLNVVRSACTALEPLLEQTGVVLAVENVLPGPATELVRLLLPDVDPQHFGFCYDSSHDQIGGPRPFGLLADLRDRVHAVHLSDRVREFVDHVPPGEGFIDWPALCQVLRTSSLSGPLLFEVMTLHAAEKDPASLLPQVYARAVDLHRQIYG